MHLSDLSDRGSSIQRLPDGNGSRNAVEMVEEITEAIRERGSATNDIAMQVERIAPMSEEISAVGNSAKTVQGRPIQSSRFTGRPMNTDILAAHRLEKRDS